MSKPQSQASLIEQLRALYVIANREGFYDAADFLRAKVEAQDAREKLDPRGKVVPLPKSMLGVKDMNEKVKELREGPMAVQMGRNDEVQDDDRPMGVSLRDD